MSAPDGERASGRGGDTPAAGHGDRGEATSAAEHGERGRDTPAGEHGERARGGDTPAAGHGERASGRGGDAPAAGRGDRGEATSAGTHGESARPAHGDDSAPRRRIAVLGVFGGAVPPGAEGLLADADVVAGGRTVVEAMAPAGARQVPLGAGLADTLRTLDGERGSVCVLASGDPGFFGIVRALGVVLGPERLDVRPAPSSVAVAFARLGLPWDDAVVVSAHAHDPRPAIHAALRHPKVAILTEPRAPAADVVEALRGSGRQITVAASLGTPVERLRTGTAEELDGERFAGPNVVLAIDPAVIGDASRVAATPARGPDRWALPEAAFEHRGGMITKAEVRAVALAALGPGTGDLVWDVGAGSGAVGIECARLGAAVIAVERDPEAVALAGRNAAAHAVPVRVVAGSAPDALAALPDPDAVFVGGGGADLAAIVDACAARTRRVVVVAVALVDRVAVAADRLAAAGLEVDGTQVTPARLRPLAGGWRLAAENPVTLVIGRRP